MTEIIHVRGEGGAVFPMQLPLSRHIQQRLDRGDLARVNADGSAFTGAADEKPPARRGRPPKQQPTSE